MKVYETYDNERAKKKIYDFAFNGPFINSVNPNETALIYQGKKITHKQLRESIIKTSVAFKNLGIKKDEVVYNFLLNNPQMVDTFYGLNNIDAISEFFNPKGATPEKIRQYINDNNIKFAVISDFNYDVFKEAVKGTNIQKVIVNQMNDSLPFPLKQGYLPQQKIISKTLNNELAQKIISKAKEKSSKINNLKTINQLLLTKNPNHINRANKLIDLYNLRGVKLEDIQFTKIEEQLLKLETFDQTQNFSRKKLSFYEDKEMNKDIFISWNDFINEYQNEKDERSFVLPKYEHQKPDFIIHTGGTSREGKSSNYKRMVHTSFSLNSFTNGALSEFDFGIKADNREEFTSLHHIPLIVFFALESIHTPLHVNVPVVIEPKYWQPDYLKVLEKNKVGIAFSASAYIEEFQDLPKLQSIDLSNLKYVFNGGSYLSPEQDENFAKNIKQIGSKAVNVHGGGASESGSCNAVNLTKEKYGSIGKCFASNEIKYLELGTNNLKENTSKNDIGEMIVSSDTMMEGYYKEDSYLNEEVFIKIDGKKYYKFGDYGYKDEVGNHNMVGRNSRIIRTDRGKFFVDDVQPVIDSNLEFIKESCIVGTLNNNKNNDLVCFLKLDKKCFDNVYEYLEYASNEIHEFAIKNAWVDEPKYFIAMENFPMTSFGKTDAKELTNMVVELGTSKSGLPDFDKTKASAAITSDKVLKK